MWVVGILLAVAGAACLYGAVRVHGLLVSDLTGTECVWHSHRVQRRYRHHDRDSEGRTRVTTRTETVAEHTAGHGFAPIRDGLTIGVDTAGRRPDGVEQVTDRFEDGERRSEGGLLGMIGALVGGDRDETIGFRYTEWVLRPGTPLSGSARNRQRWLAWIGAGLAITGPPDRGGPAHLTGYRIRGSRGRPSSRSATWLRAISEVPPAMVMQRDHR
jgi:hypothetical protein